MKGSSLFPLVTYSKIQIILCTVLTFFIDHCNFGSDFIFLKRAAFQNSVNFGNFWNLIIWIEKLSFCVIFKYVSQRNQIILDPPNPQIKRWHKTKLQVFTLTLHEMVVGLTIADILYNQVPKGQNWNYIKSNNKATSIITTFVHDKAQTLCVFYEYVKYHISC